MREPLHWNVFPHGVECSRAKIAYALGTRIPFAEAVPDTGIPGDSAGNPDGRRGKAAVTLLDDYRGLNFGSMVADCA